MPQYQGVWTLEQQAQAQAQSNQQWVTDPNFKNTTLLLQADGTGSGSQNNTFLDGSTNNFFVTRYGNTTQGSFSPFSQAPGSWSNYFVGGSNNSITFASSAGFAFGTGDFSIETFAFANSIAGGWRILAFPTATVCNIEQVSGNLIGINFGFGTVNVNAPITVGQWFHLAVTRQSGVVRVFLNGQLTYTAANTSDYSTSQIVYAGGYVGFNQSWDGFLSNMRIQKGAVPTAYQTSSTTIGAQIFNPPTSSLTSDANTSVLSCQSNRFVDNSSNALTVTSTNASVQAFGPFAPALQWTPDVVGGSGYFDGTGDLLQVPSSSNLALGTGDFTMELWVYPTSWNSALNQSLFSGNSTNYAPGLTASQYYPGKLVLGFEGVFTIIEDAVLPTTNMWSHVACTRSGNTFKIFINGVQSGSTITYSADFSSPIRNVGSNNTSAGFFNGYISSARIIKGTALYTTTFTPPTAPFTAITNTQLLFNYTNAGVYDGKMNTSWETTNNVQVSTSVVKYGSGSMYFDGTANQRLLPSQSYPQFTYGTGDFTIECWIYVIGKNATSAAGIYEGRPGVNGTYPSWWVDFGGYGVGSATAPRLVWYADSAVFMSSGVISMGAWNHIAFSRANGVSRMYINGVISGSPTADTKNYLGGGSAGNFRPVIGSSDGGDSLYGYFDDFRISRFARYIANFTPPQQALPRQ